MVQNFKILFSNLDLIIYLEWVKIYLKEVNIFYRKKVNYLQQLKNRFKIELINLLTMIRFMKKILDQNQILLEIK
jgi:hypothetical protein